MTVRRLLAALLAAAVLVAAAGTAAAADEASVSLDGRHWTARISTPLFDPAFRWVPGDRYVKTFYVRNDGPSLARMTVEVLTRDPDGWIGDEELVLSARVGSGPWTTLRNGADIGALVEDAVRRQGIAAVDVRVDFPATSTSASERSELPFAFRVTLTQAGPVVDEGQGAGPGSGQAGFGGGLAGTGTDLREWLIWLGAASVGVGLALVLGRRREGSHG